MLFKNFLPIAFCLPMVAYQTEINLHQSGPVSTYATAESSNFLETNNNENFQNTNNLEVYNSYIETDAKVIFFEDFSNSNFGKGKNDWYVYEYDAHDDVIRPHITQLAVNGGRWMKMPRKGYVYPNTNITLPEKVTIEYNLYCDEEQMSEMEGGFKFIFTSIKNRVDYSMYFSDFPELSLDVHPHGNNTVQSIVASKEYNPNTSGAERTLYNKTNPTDWNTNKINKVKIVRQGTAVTLYLNGTEKLHLANGLPQKNNYTFILATNLWGDGMYVSDIKILTP